MKPRRLEWIWEDEDVLQPDPLGDLEAATSPTRQNGGVEAHPDEASAAGIFDANGDGSAERSEAPAPRREPRRRGRRIRPRRRRVGAWARGARFWGLVALALAIGTVAPQLIERSGRGGAGEEGGVPLSDQRVVAWQVLDEEGRAHLAVFAAGGKPAVAVAIPAEVTINLPGQSVGTLQDAADSGPELVEVSVENLLGVPVDRIVTSDASELAAAIDAGGGVEILDERMGGVAALDYLAQPGEDAPVDAVFLRWQDVLHGLLAEADRDEVAAAMPEPIRPIVAAGPVDLTALPVIDIGAGLLRPDTEALERMVSERFVAAAGEEVRLVVLNGVGSPGIGEEVARTLVPEGFRLVSSGNARDFDFKETQIVASSRDDVPAAERARDLLGVGRIVVGNQPTGLTDVTVVVGRDFGGS